jgi:ATP-dependent helicase/nuclease subunit A
MSGPRWTPDQLAAITRAGKAILVSAGAGSGKTAALSARCAHLVFDAAAPCDIDRILVLTFTNAAAAEMRHRIEKAVRDRAGNAPDTRHRKQLRLLDRSSITTLDAFSLQLIRSHFHTLGLDPTFRLLDEDDARLLRIDAAEALLDEQFESAGNDAFLELLRQQCNGHTDTLRERLLRTVSLLASVVDPEAWLDRCEKRLREFIADPTSGELADAHAAAIAREIDRVRGPLQRGIVFFEAQANGAKFRDHLQQFVDLLDSLQQSSQSRDWDSLGRAFSAFEPKRSPNVPKDSPEWGEIRDKAKKRWKSLDESQRLAWTTDQLVTSLHRIVPGTAEFVRLVRLLRARLDAEKRQLRALDFSDLNTLALQLLRDPNCATLAPSPLAMQVQQQFDHVMVDEFQDINPIQSAILQLVSTDLSATSNLFAVGDVKQSIYGFRLAEPQQFIDRYDALSAAGNARGEVINLRANFRSRPGVLEAVNHVFKRLMSRSTAQIDYTTAHELICGNPDNFPVAPIGASLPGKPAELHVLVRDTLAPAHDDPENAADDSDVDELEQFEREALVIARRIHDMMSSDPIEFRDFAVLLRSKAVKSTQAAQILGRYGIPAFSEDSSGFFDTTEVQDLLALLELLSNEQQDVPLAALIRSPMSGVSEADDALARIRLFTPDSKVPFHQAARRYASEMQDELARQLRLMFDALAAHRQLIQRRPIDAAIDRLLDETGYLQWVRGLRDGPQRVANIEELRRRAIQFGSFERQGLERFLQFINDLRDEGDIGQPSIADESANVVRVMTVHKSKGLEFPVVFVPDLGKMANKSDLIPSILLDRDLGAGLCVVEEDRLSSYSSLARTAIADSLDARQLAEEIRVLYVALTRAKEHLILIGSETRNAKLSDEPFEGAMNPAEVAAARAPLQWMLPIATSTNRDAPGTFEITKHDAAALLRIEQSLPRAGRREGVSPAVQLLRPFDDAPLQSAHRVVFERVQWHYPHREATLVESRQRITDLVQKQPHLSQPTDLPMPPTWKTTQGKGNATEVGSATHAALMHLDFSRSDLAAQLAEMESRCLLSADQRKMVDVEALAWFQSTPLGQLLASQSTTQWRELPIALGRAAGDSTDARDRVLLRGRIDVLFRTRAGLEVIDYKTDQINVERLPARVEQYRPQVMAYRQAIEQITGEKVRAVHLVFLIARRIVGAD